MYISYAKLDRAGYNVNPKKEGVEIHAKDPVELPYDGIRELLETAGLTQKETDHGIEAMAIEVETLQIMDAIR